MQSISMGDIHSHALGTGLGGDNEGGFYNFTEFFGPNLQRIPFHE
jgi:hypothetical protein